MDLLDFDDMKNILGTLFIGAGSVTVTLTFVNTVLATVVGVLTVIKITIDIYSKLHKKTPTD